MTFMAGVKPHHYRISCAARATGLFSTRQGRVDIKPGIDITAQEMIAVRENLLQGLNVQDDVIDFNLLMHPPATKD
jgi:hypothetical protein